MSSSSNTKVKLIFKWNAINPSAKVFQADVHKLGIEHHHVADYVRGKAQKSNFPDYTRGVQSNAVPFKF